MLVHCQKSDTMYVLDHEHMQMVSGIFNTLNAYILHNVFISL